MSYSLLLDIYGQLLTDKQREVMEYYYNNDYSLSEISEHLNISRQGVRDAIVHAENNLKKFEETLALAGEARRTEQIKKLAQEIVLKSKDETAVKLAGQITALCR